MTMTTDTPAFLLRPQTRAFEARIDARARELLDRFIRRTRSVPEHGSDERRRLRDAAERDCQHQLARDLHALEQRLTPMIAPDRIAALNLHVHALGELLGVRVLYLGDDDTRAHARRDQDTAVVPLISDDSQYALSLHELGHAIDARCHGDGHEMIVVGRTAACVLCETRAWQTALDLALLWSGLMQQRLVRALEGYRAVTPAGASVLLDVARLCGPMAEQQRQARRTQRDIWLEQDAYARRLRPWRFEQEIRR
jgi:hypothetical protein